MNIYLISDNLTSEALTAQDIIKKEFWFLLKKKKNSILFVESAWQGLVIDQNNVR